MCVVAHLLVVHSWVFLMLELLECGYAVHAVDHQVLPAALVGRLLDLDDRLPSVAESMIEVLIFLTPCGLIPRAFDPTSQQADDTCDKPSTMYSRDRSWIVRTTMVLAGGLAGLFLAFFVFPLFFLGI